MKSLVSLIFEIMLCLNVHLQRNRSCLYFVALIFSKTMMVISNQQKLRNSNLVNGSFPCTVKEFVESVLWSIFLIPINNTTYTYVTSHFSHFLPFELACIIYLFCRPTFWFCYLSRSKRHINVFVAYFNANIICGPSIFLSISISISFLFLIFFYLLCFDTET